MGPEGIILVNPPITTFQQSLTHSAMLVTYQIDRAWAQGGQAGRKIVKAVHLLSIQTGCLCFGLSVVCVIVFVFFHCLCLCQCGLRLGRQAGRLRKQAAVWLCLQTG